MEFKCPLVSVFVVTYNSEPYIIETLESVKNQTYDKIELIVSDDCSTDGTVDLVKQWIENNPNRFLRTEVVTIDENKGIPANYNRAVNACQGEWLKMLDGDDLLLPTCIEDNIKFIQDNKNAEVVFSDCIKFKTSGEIIGRVFDERFIRFFEMDAESQLKELLASNILPSQTCFIKAQILKDYPYEERYYFLEDAPKWIQLTSNGIKIFGFSDATAKYRIGESTMRSRETYFNRPYYETSCQFFWDVKVKLIRKYKLQDAYDAQRKYFFERDIIDVILENKKSKFNDLIYNCIHLIIRLFVKFKL